MHYRSDVSDPTADGVWMGGPGDASGHSWAVTSGDGIFDALAAPSVVVDHDGLILMANRAWDALFPVDPTVEPDTGVGSDYLAAWAQTMAGREELDAARRGVAAVLAGELTMFELEAASGDGARQRWFLVTVAPVAGIGAVIQHVEITRRKRLEQRLAHLAGHDPLTGALNRTALEHDLHRLLSRADGPCAGVLYADLDGFKAVNDTYGHRTGDEVLSQVAGRIRACVRPDDVVARVGGDEFVIVIDDADPDGILALHLAQRIHAAVTQPYRIGDQTVTIGISIGTTTAHPGDDVRAVLAHADHDMYRLKSATAE